MKRERRLKRLWFFALIGFFSIGYFSLNHLNLHRSSYIDVVFPFEQHIPFVPAAIGGYLVVYVSLLVLYVLLDTTEDFYRGIVTMFLLIAVHFFIFAFFPVRMEFRPDLSSASGIAETFARWYFWIDQPTNCFPSLHVAFPTAGTWLIWRRHPRWRMPYLAMALTTAVSVVIVKQHYLVDVVAGAVTALVVCWFSEKCVGSFTLLSGRP